MDIIVGKSTLKESEINFTRQAEYALFIDKTTQSKTNKQFEAYFENVHDQGSIILSLNAPNEFIQSIERCRSQPMVLPDGMVKILVDSNFSNKIRQLTVASITFIPTKRIDSELFTSHFGKPDLEVEKHDMLHRLYKKLCLDFPRTANGQDILQITYPDNYSCFLYPLF